MENEKLKNKIVDVYGTQQAFAKALGVSVSSVSRFINGSRAWRGETVIKAAKLLGIDGNEIDVYFFSVSICQRGKTMKAALGNYERLGQFFKSKAELAAAGCMTRPTLAQALSGPRGFTNNEKQAIKNALVVKVIKGTAKHITVEELLSGDFDELFRIKE